MNPHLSSEQLSECIAGFPRPMVARHVEHCTACRAELAQFREALGEFRGAVRTWSEDQAHAAMAASAPVAEPRSWTASHQLAWALAIAAICVIASFLRPWHTGAGARTNDAVLLNQVDAEVSRTVPSSMEPLMNLVVEKQ